MSFADKPAHPWQRIAAEASREKDPQRLIALTPELEDALDWMRAIRSTEASFQRNANQRHCNCAIRKGGLLLP
jgi:hypothetical protein